MSLNKQSSLFELEVAETIRSLGFYQPFGSLMLHGKIETRWVQAGKKPPFPKGKYIFYTTKQHCERYILFNWCGPELMGYIDHVLLYDKTKHLDGFAIGIGELAKIRPMTKGDELGCFVKFEGVKEMSNISGGIVTKRQWCLEFTNIKPIQPFAIKGKQGVGILNAEDISKIMPL